MGKETKLRELLSELIIMAHNNKNELTIEEIESYLKEIELNNTKLELIYDYLEANKVIILGHTKNNQNQFEQVYIGNYLEKEEIELTGQLGDKLIYESEQQEQQYVEMYLKDISFITPCTKLETEILVQKLLEENELAKKRLIEGHLSFVVEIAQKFKGQGMLVADLIQEGNMVLIQAVDSYKKQTDKIHFLKYMKSTIETTLEQIIGEVKQRVELNERVINKINFLNENINQLKQELGKKPTVEEIAEFMEITESEVRDIIQLAKQEDIEVQIHP